MSYLWGLLYLSSALGLSSQNVLQVTPWLVEDRPRVVDKGIVVFNQRLLQQASWQNHLANEARYELALATGLGYGVEFASAMHTQQKPLSGSLAWHSWLTALKWSPQAIWQAFFYHPTLQIAFYRASFTPPQVQVALSFTEIFFSSYVAAVQLKFRQSFWSVSRLQHLEGRASFWFWPQSSALGVGALVVQTAQWLAYVNNEDRQLTTDMGLYAALAPLKGWTLMLGLPFQWQQDRQDELKSSHWYIWPQLQLTFGVQLPSDTFTY